MSMKPYLDLKEEMLKGREERLIKREKALVEKQEEIEQKEQSKTTETLANCIKMHYENTK